MSIQSEESLANLNALLRQAASEDALETAKSLVKAGANYYDTDEQGRTAFNHAASNGLRTLAWMAEDAFFDTQKPLHEKRFVDFGINTPSGYYGSTLITYAAKVSSADVVKQMIDAHADITIVNGSGWTLLHCAAVMPGRTEVLKILLEAFRAQHGEQLIAALTTHVYKTEYAGHAVIYDVGLTAAGLCHARMQQDPSCPQELARYLELLS